MYDLGNYFFGINNQTVALLFLIGTAKAPPAMDS